MSLTTLTSMSGVSGAHLIQVSNFRVMGIIFAFKFGHFDFDNTGIDIKFLVQLPSLLTVQPTALLFSVLAKPLPLVSKLTALQG